MPQLAQININGFGYWVSNNNKFIGMSSVDLPDIQRKTATLSGLGIAGDLKVPIPSAEPMEATIHFREPTEDVYGLFAPEIHHIEIRSIVRHQSTAPHSIKVVEDRYVLIMEPLSLKLGSIKTAEEQGLELPITLYAITGYHDEKRILMLDPANIIWEINGVDYLKPVREKGGIA
jgi:P2 family phage contractile tail tube protein